MAYTIIITITTITISLFIVCHPFITAINLFHYYFSSFKQCTNFILVSICPAATMLFIILCSTPTELQVSPNDRTNVSK